MKFSKVRQKNPRARWPRACAAAAASCMQAWAACTAGPHAAGAHSRTPTGPQVLQQTASDLPELHDMFLRYKVLKKQLKSIPVDKGGLGCSHDVAGAAAAAAALQVLHGRQPLPSMCTTPHAMPACAQWAMRIRAGPLPCTYCRAPHACAELATRTEPADDGAQGEGEVGARRGMRGGHAAQRAQPPAATRPPPPAHALLHSLPHTRTHAYTQQRRHASCLPPAPRPPSPPRATRAYTHNTPLRPARRAGPAPAAASCRPRSSSSSARWTRTWASSTGSSWSARRRR